MSLLIALAAHAVLALACGLLGRRMGRSVLWLAAVAPAIAFAVSVAATPSVLDEQPLEISATWVPGMGLGLDLLLDGFGLVMWWIISGIGVLVMVYARGYFGERDDLGRFAAILLTFAGAMLLLTSADDLWLLFVAWEITSITSYLLIGFEDSKAAARASARQALLVTGGGGLALLGGIVLLTQQAGTSSMAELLASPPTGGIAEAGLLLVLLGCMTKSAQAPFHFWLPGAMAAPTPVSAYLHSATMVKAGIYLLARVGPAFAPQVDWWPTTLLVVGGGTMLLGGWRALTATDLKALLAFGTVSQLGFIVLLVGYGDAEMLFGGIAVLVAHSLFKATLFMTAGIVDHQAHTREAFRLDAMRSVMPITFVAATIATASMAGVLPLFGAVAKEGALEGTVHLAERSGLVTGLIITGSALTAAYGLRYVTAGFLGAEVDRARRDVVAAADVKRPSAVFVAPTVVLTVLTVVLGPWNAPAQTFVKAGATALNPETAEFKLKLWHGFGPSLYSSLAALAIGFLVWRGLVAVRAAKKVTGVVPAAADVYESSLKGLLRLANRTVAIVQPGSLPIYLGIILITAVVLPASTLLPGLALGEVDLAASPLQLVVAVLIMVAALATTVITTRLSTVLVLGSVGFGVAILFVIQGAPDLALTQLLIETLSLGMFVLVLRRLPPRFSQPAWKLGTGLRIALAAAVGSFMTLFALAATGARINAGPAAEFLARAEPEGGGKNVVNVILTDFRAMDTLGEVTVLAIAAVGVVSIVRAGRARDLAESSGGDVPPVTPPGLDPPTGRAPEEVDA